jgi:S1-C subfamily serine protease
MDEYIRVSKKGIGLLLLTTGLMIVGLMVAALTGKREVGASYTDTAHHVFSAARTSVVKLSNMEATTGGSGVEILGLASKKPYVLTNYHVCDGYLETGMLAQTVFDKHLVKVLHVDPAHDLCLTSGAGAVVMPISSESPKFYEMVFNVGHPLLKAATPTQGRLVAREILEIGSSADANGKCPPGHKAVQDLFEIVCLSSEELDMTTTVIFPGSSGSPAFNEKGELIGLFNSGDGRTNYGNMIPLTHVKDFLKDK